MDSYKTEDYGRAARLGFMFGIGIVLIVAVAYTLQGCGDGTPIEEEPNNPVVCDDGFVCADPGFIESLRGCCERPTPDCREDELRRTIAGLRDDLRRTEEALRVAEAVVGTCQVERDECEGELSECGEALDTCSVDLEEQRRCRTLKGTLKEYYYRCYHEDND